MLKFKDITNIRFDAIRTGGDFQGRILFEQGSDTYHVWVDHQTLAVGYYYGKRDKKGLYQYPTDEALRKTAGSKVLNLETKATQKVMDLIVAEVRKHKLVETCIAEMVRLDAEAQQRRQDEQVAKTQKAFRDMLLSSLEQGLLPPAKVNEIEIAMTDVKPESWLILRRAVLGA